MIQLLTTGGLGNQLFEYAFALQLQRANGGKKIYINPILHKITKDGRNLSLQHYKLAADTRICSAWQAAWLLTRFIASCLKICGVKAGMAILRKNRKAFDPLKQKLVDAGVYIWFDTFKLPEIALTSVDNYVMGYFQTPLVLENIEDELRDAFTVVTPASKANQKQLNEIKSCNAVCLHIRRGDYSLFPQLQVCGEAYYQQAVAQACQTLENPVFYVFSNSNEDIQWIKENYHFDAELRYVELENPDYEELRLMSACQHFIISNSTFSWWAAVLGSNAAKKVWAPKTWMKDAGVIDMALDGWSLIDA